MDYGTLDRLVAQTTSLDTVAYAYDVLGRRTQMRVNDLNRVTDMKRREVLESIIGTVLAILWPTHAFANIGLPMLAVYLPPAWLSLIPIIAIEAALGVWRFGVPPGPAFIAQAVANCLSTLVGLPLTWALLALIELCFFGTALGLSTAPRRVYAVTVQAPWLIPYESDFWWMIPVSVGVLTVPFYAMSVVLEYAVVRRLLPEFPQPALRSWVVRGNIVSYAALVLVLVTASIWSTPFTWMFSTFAPISEWIMAIVFWLARLGVER
jgi:YD repeat-containing protein